MINILIGISRSKSEGDKDVLGAGRRFADKHCYRMFRVRTHFERWTMFASAVFEDQRAAPDMATATADSDT